MYERTQTESWTGVRLPSPPWFITFGLIRFDHECQEQIMGIIEIMFKDPKMIEIVAVMVFGSIVWLLAMRELLRKDKAADGNNVIANLGEKLHKQAANTTIVLTYITKEQIMDLTAEQVKEIPESEVEKLPTAMKDMFKRRKNEVLLADRAKNSQ